MARAFRIGEIIGGGSSGSTRGTGGIGGPGGVNVNPVYKNQVDYVKPIPQGAPPKKISSSVTIKAPKKK